MIEEWEELQAIVLGYIYNKGIDAFNKGVSRLKNTYFSGDYLWLWGIVLKYSTQTMGVPSSLDQFRKFSRSVGVKEEKLLELEERLGACVEKGKEIDDASFVWHIGRLGEVYRHIKFEDVLENSHKSLIDSGYDVAKDKLLTSLSKLESGGIDLAQEGDVLEETDDVLKEMREAKTTRRQRVVDFGFESIDRHVFGLEGGELVLIAGWTGVGKTCLCVNVGLDVAINQKKNVVYITTETTRTPLRRRIYSRITKLPEFAKLTPVTVGKMKSGDLDDKDKSTIEAAVRYLKAKPHGVFQVVQAPARVTTNWIRGKLLQFEGKFPVHLVIMDDLRSLTPTQRRKAEFEELSQIVKELKGIAVSHANRSVPIISPHHINRSWYEKVLSREGDISMFDLAGLAGTSEAEKRSDLVLGLWYNAKENPGLIDVYILKHRDGSLGGKVQIGVEWEYQYMYEQERSPGDI